MMICEGGSSGTARHEAGVSRKICTRMVFKGRVQGRHLHAMAWVKPYECAPGLMSAAYSMMILPVLLLCFAPCIMVRATLGCLWTK